MEKIQLSDFLDFNFLSALQISNDGKYALFARHKCNEEENNYTSDIWAFDRAKGISRQITTTGKDKSFTFLDSRNIICPTVTGKGRDTSTIFERVSIETCDREEMFTLPLKASIALPVNSQEYLIYATINNTKPDDLPENGADWVILEELPFAANGTGFVSGLRKALFIYNAGDNSLTAITSPYFQTKDFSLNLDNGKVVYFGSQYAVMEQAKVGIYVYDLKTKETIKVLDDGLFRIRHVDMIGDKVFFSGSETKKYKLVENAHLYQIDVQSKKNTKIHESFQMPINNWIGSDCRYGEGELHKICGNDIYYVITEMENSHIVKVTPHGGEVKITTAQGSVDCFDIYDDEIIFVGMRDRRLQELYSISIDGGSEKQLTTINEDFYASKSIVAPEPCNFVNSCGDLIQGFVLKPCDFDESKKYPAILDIHGGPKTTYGTVYYHEMQFWANHGYFVFFCNPTGSDGRGDAFGYLLGRYGTVDYDDVMQFTDTVLERYPNIDKDRLGVTGGSYGGFLTNFIVGKTDRFAAAASQRSISSWISQEGASDTGHYCVPSQFGVPARMDIETAFVHSPLKYVDNIKTPMLFIHSEEDFRCPPAEAFQIFTTIINKGVETRMCLFKNENHELSRSGKPKNRAKRLEEITDWMDKHLKEGRN